MVNDGLITHPSAALARPLQKGDPKFSDLMVEVVDFHRLGWLHPDIKPENFLVKKRPYYWDVAFRSPRPPPPVLRGLALLAFFCFAWLVVANCCCCCCLPVVTLLSVFCSQIATDRGKGSYCKNEKKW
jgi:serine/threonine protein kinase